MATSPSLPVFRVSLLLLLAGLLVGCASSHGERSDVAPGAPPAANAEADPMLPADALADGAAIAAAAIDPEHDLAVRDALSKGVAAGLAGYRLAPGDAVEVLYHISTEPVTDRYLIGMGDVLEIEFNYTPELNRTLTVRPDGRITLPRIGDLAVAGLEPAVVSQAVRDAFADTLRNPEITVNVEKFTNRTEILTAALDRTERGQSKRLPVDPSGMLHLPLLKALPAAGMTLDELTTAATAAYRSEFGNLRVSTLLESIAGNRVFVFGEVRNPGPQPITGPTSVAQAIAAAGGALTTAALGNVRLIFAGADGRTEIRSLNLSGLKSDTPPDLGKLVPSNSTVYVPPSGIAQLNRFVDQYVKQLFLFTGSSIGLSYELNRTQVSF